MAKRRKHQGIDWLVGQYRRIAKDPQATIAQRMKALDRLAVIDEVLNIQLIEPNDVTRRPEPTGPQVDAEDQVEKALNEILGRRKSKKGEKDGIPSGHKGRD